MLHKSVGTGLIVLTAFSRACIYDAFQFKEALLNFRTRRTLRQVMAIHCWTTLDFHAAVDHVTVRLSPFYVAPLVMHFKGLARLVAEHKHHMRPHRRNQTLDPRRAEFTPLGPWTLLDYLLVRVGAFREAGRHRDRSRGQRLPKSRVMEVLPERRAKIVTTLTGSSVGVVVVKV